MMQKKAAQHNASQNERNGKLFMFAFRTVVLTVGSNYQNKITTLFKVKVNALSAAIPLYVEVILIRI